MRHLQEASEEKQDGKASFQETHSPGRKRHDARADRVRGKLRDKVRGKELVRNGVLHVRLSERKRHVRPIVATIIYWYLVLPAIEALTPARYGVVSRWPRGHIRKPFVNCVCQFNAVTTSVVSNNFFCSRRFNIFKRLIKVRMV